MNDDLYTVSTPSDVHCNYCDAVNRNVDIFDDTRTGDWAYLFECRACERINDEHGNNYERGSVDVYALLIIVPILFGLALAFIGLLGHSWSLVSFGLGTAAIVTLAARVAAVERNRS